jgi:hypothetical protein
MLHSTIKQLAVLVFAGASFCFASAQRASGADWVPVSADAVCEDECDEPRPSCGQCLCRKLRLHCVYSRRAFTCRYIALPYTQPNSILYYSPAAAGAPGYGMPNCPGVGPTAGYSNGYGYGAYGSGPTPAYAAPGSVFVR